MDVHLSWRIRWGIGNFGDGGSTNSKNKNFEYFSKIAKPTHKHKSIKNPQFYNSTTQNP